MPMFESGGKQEIGEIFQKQKTDWEWCGVPTDRYGMPLISVEPWSSQYFLMQLKQQLDKLPADDTRRKPLEQMIEIYRDRMLGKEGKHSLTVEDLPDVADERDKVELLPDIADEGDEIDVLPDVDDREYPFSGEVERTRTFFKKIDNVFQTSGTGEEKHIERRDKMKDIVRYCNPLEMVKSVAYFSTVSLVTKVNFFYRAIDHYSSIELDETIVGDIKNIFDEVVTPQFVKDHLGNTLLDTQYVASEMAELTCKAVDAATYIGSKGVLGVAKVVEDAVIFVAGTIADVAGHPEMAEKMYQKDIVGEISEYIDKNYSGSELIKEIGACAEKVGEIGAYIGLGILAGGEGAVAAAAAAGIGVARAGEAVRGAVEKTGEYTHKEQVYGIVCGAVAVILPKLIGTIHAEMGNVGESLSEAAKSIDGKAVRYIAEKVAGTAAAAGEGAIDAWLFDMLDIITEEVASALGIDDAVEVDIKEIVKDMGMGALASGVLFLVSDIIKDIGKYAKEKPGEDIKRVELGEKEWPTEQDRQNMKEATGWSDEKLKKCTIDENGVIHYKTDRCDLEGKTSENGVPYRRRTIEINGVKVEGVFPEFDSAFDTKLDQGNYKSKTYAKECNAKLEEVIKNDPELRSKFTKEQLNDIKEGRTPTGYVWHHNEEPGKMQLVKRVDHDRAIGGAAHTGGNALWGADSVDNSKKGESF